MSISDSGTANPDGSVLWYWYNETSEYNKKATKENRRGAIKRFERWLATKGNYSHACHWSDIDLEDVSPEEMVDPATIDEHDVEEFLNALAETYAPDTQQNTASVLTRAYSWLSAKTTCVEANPFDYVLNTEDKGRGILDTPTGRDAYFIPLEDARYYVRDWERPRYACVNLIAAKYSRRAGGISNLDIQDVNLDHPACQWSVHPDVRHWDDHILFRPDKEAGDSGRKSGNKTRATAKYPLDKEMKHALLWYLATRPEPADPTDPLFLDSNYERLGGASISSTFQQKAREITQRDEGPKCWYGAHDDDNINAHYWRHWATTWYQDHTGEQALVDYLRGDTGEGSSANYDQYSDMKRQKILGAMPTFYEPYIDE